MPAGAARDGRKCHQRQLRAWNIICGLFEQIDRIIGEERISNGTLKDLISAGLGEGGNRSCTYYIRCGYSRNHAENPCKQNESVAVVGANEGVLPVEHSDSGTLTDKNWKLWRSLSLI